MKRSTYAAALVLSVLLVLSSVYWPVTVHNQPDLVNAEIKLGLPLPFLFQNQDLSSFPRQTKIRIPLENPTQILLPQFLLNLAIVFGMLSFILMFSKRLFQR